MSYGLIVRDSGGTVILNVSDRITRYIATFGVSLGSGGSTFLGVSGMSADGTWYIYNTNHYLKATITSGGVSVANLTNSSWSGSILVFRV